MKLSTEFKQSLPGAGNSLQVYLDTCEERAHEKEDDEDRLEMEENEKEMEIEEEKEDE